jgi:hypothetical protein
MDRLINDPERGEARIEVTLTQVETNPPVDGNPFKAVVPPGYSKTDQFAP